MTSLQTRNCFVAIMFKYVSSCDSLICKSVLLHVRITLLEPNRLPFIALQNTRLKNKTTFFTFMTHRVISLVCNNNTCVKFSRNKWHHVTCQMTKYLQYATLKRTQRLKREFYAPRGITVKYTRTCFFLSSS